MSALRTISFGAFGNTKTRLFRASGQIWAWGCLVNEAFYVRPVEPGRVQIYLPQLAYLGPQ